ncbi:two-component regulator propeller domain-containing protein [Pleionea sediminis]|uniref:two-component regulator propeller domain-containing protein n=1 Tax=Pleionea sediminis TaxID=2569479 RepID=UPI0011856F1A|nr:two-component regulator propeller domain-containing protein [Pleionea sediminis]
MKLKFSLFSSTVFRLRKASYLLFFCLLVLTGIQTAHSNSYLEKLSFNHITSAEGLPQNTVTSIIQDRHGFLWIGTHYGLHRYDGYEFISYNYDPRDENSISSNVITAILEAPDGKIWVGTAQKGLNKFDPETGKFTRYTASASDFDSISHNHINALHIDKQNRLWIGTSNGLNLYQEKEENFVYIYYNPLDDQTIPRGSVTAISSDGQNNLFVATTEMLSWFDTQQMTFKRFSEPDSPSRITELFLDEDNTLWIGTQLQGLFHLNQRNNRFKQYIHNPNDKTTISSNYIQTILRDSKGNLWIGTEQGGLNLKPRARKQFYHFQKNAADIHSISINDILTVTEDKSGQIWIGTAGGGINKTTPHFQNFSRLQHSPFDTNSLSHNFVWNIKQDKNDDIWFATLSGINRYTPETQNFEHFQTLYDQDGREISNRITALTTTQDGYIWFGTQQGQVVRFNPSESGRAETFDRGSTDSFIPGRFSNNRIRLMMRDRMNNIWVSTDEGLAVLSSESGEIIEDFREASMGELGTSVVYTIFQDDQGIMWFGTWDSGLQRYDPEFRQTRTFQSQTNNQFSLSDNTVRSIHQDNQGNLWIGTHNGLNLLNSEDRIKGNFRFYSFTENDGLPNNSIYSITTDDSGYLWVGTNRGLSRFQPSTKEFKNFSIVDGLPAAEFNGNSVLKSNDGLLYFGSVSGVAVINPNGITSSQYRPPQVFTQLSINGNNYFENNRWSPLSEVVLEYDQNNIQLKFSALDFQIPERIKYAYRLDPYETEWKEVQGKNSVQYGNLSPGIYTFEFKSTNSDQIWFENIKTLKITINPPLWATWWAYSLYVFLLLSLIGWYMYRHSQKLHEQQRINEHLRRVDKLKDDFLANTSHELRTPLNGIIGIAESLREGIAGQLNDKTLGHLNLIIDSGKQLAHQVNEILDFKKLRHHGLLLNRGLVDLRVASKVVINLLKPLADEKQLQLTNSLPQFLPPVYADENRLRQILYNLIGNAIKYTDSGFVEITARVVDDVVEMCIKDSGVGIPENKKSVIFKPFEQLETSGKSLKSGTGLGLAVTRQLVELHGGNIWLESQTDVGSSFYFTLPINEQPATATTTVIAEEHKELPPITLVKETSNKQTLPAAGHAKILVVDDDTLNRQVLNDFLSMHNYSVTEAADGLQALEAIKRESFDLVILDVMMPHMSGFEATEKLRERYSLLEMPILLLSAKNQPEDINTGLSVGANDYISKPIDRKILMARVSNLLMLRQVYHSQQERAQLKAMEQTCDQLSRYFPRPLVERILDGDEMKDIQPERRCITVLFADLVGFTQFSDRFEPETVTDVLNEFLTEMSKIVAKHQGLLNEVLGDGLVILFGALEQLDKPSQAIKAIELAIDMNKAIESLSEKWRATGLEQQLNLRIGVHQSYVTLGNFGSEEMIVFRAIGSGVNLAARIQALCEPGDVLVSYPVFAQGESVYNFEEFDEVKFKGFNHNHRIYKLINQSES